MIKLFRNTRKKLLSENKFSKYLAYAIGEIFLVVLGILIALWINNANQESINEKKAEVILKEIQRDLKKRIWTTRMQLVSHLYVSTNYLKVLLLERRKILKQELTTLWKSMQAKAQAPSKIKVWMRVN